MKQHCPQNLWSMKYYSIFQPLYILHLAFPVLVCKLFYGDSILSCFSEARTEAFHLFHFSSLIINWCVCIRRVLFWEKKKKKVSEITNAQGKIGNFYAIKITLKESRIVERGERTFQEVIIFSNSALDTFFTFKRKLEIISQ